MGKGGRKVTTNLKSAQTLHHPILKKIVDEPTPRLTLRTVALSFFIYGKHFSIRAYPAAASVQTSPEEVALPCNSPTLNHKKFKTGLDFLWIRSIFSPFRLATLPSLEVVELFDVSKTHAEHHKLKKLMLSQISSKGLLLLFYFHWAPLADIGRLQEGSHACLLLFVLLLR
jgi:hypothetical protein